MARVAFVLVVILMVTFGLLGAPVASQNAAIATPISSRVATPADSTVVPRVLPVNLATVPPIGVWSTATPTPRFYPVKPVSTMNPAHFTRLAPISTAGLVSPSPAPRP